MIALLFFLAIVHAAKPTGTWKVMPLQPPPRSKHGQVKLWNDTIVIHGGRSPGGESLSDMWTYNITSKTFAELKLHGNAPGARYVHSCVVVHGRIFVWGGLLNDQPSIAYDLISINPVSGLSVNVPSEIPGRWRHATVVLGTKMIVAFGIARGMRNDVWSFDTETYSWTELVPVNTPPVPRFHPCCEPFNTTAILCFGGTLVNVSDSNQVFLYDTMFRRWEEQVPDPASPKPYPRNLAACYFNPSTKKLTISHGWSGADLFGFHDMWDFDVVSRRWALVVAVLGYEDIDSSDWTPMPDGNAYFFGGWGEETTINSLWQHNIATRKSTLDIISMAQPGPRFLHCMVNVGQIIYVLFGASPQRTVLSDIWAYDTVKGGWTPMPYDGPPIRLYGASCVVRGTIIFIFGGKLTLTEDTFSNHLYMIDTTYIPQLTSSLVIPSGTKIPPPRFLAGITLFISTCIVVYGGKGSAVSPFGDVWIFLTPLFEWRLVTRFASKPVKPWFWEEGMAAPGYRYKTSLVNIGRDRILLANGDDGITNFHDRWITHPIFQGITDAATIFMNFSVIEDTSESPMIQSDVVRTSAGSAVGYNGTRVMFFGGSVDGTSMVDRSSFQTFDTKTGMNEILAPMPIAVTEAPAVFIGDTVFIFGGRRSFLGVVFEPMSELQRFTFDPSSLCPTEDDTSGCQTCPVGFFPPKCLPCPFNTYFSETHGGKCIECVLGRTNTKLGIVGRVGCTLDDGITVNTSLIPDSKTYHQQPEPFVPGKTPFALWIGVMAVAGVSFLTIMFLIFGVGHLQVKRRNQWIVPEMHAVLVRMFEEVQGGGVDDGGVSEKELFVLFQLLATEQCRYVLTEEWIAELVQKYDGDGSRLIEIEEFEDMILECCLNPEQDFNVDWRQHGCEEKVVPRPMKPLPAEGDPERADMIQIKTKAMGRLNFTLKSMDKFYDAHTVGALGEAMYFKATQSGGVATFCWIFGVAVIVLALSGEQRWANEMEQRASQPYLTLEFDIRSQVEVTISLMGSGYVTNGATDADVQAACKGFDAGFVAGANVIMASSSVACSAADGVFNVTWSCASCNFGSNTAVLQIRSADDRAYGSAIRLNVKTTTGIQAPEDEVDQSVNLLGKQQISVTHRAIFAPPSSIMRGLVSPSVFFIDVFPSVYGWKDDIASNNKAETLTGYHVYITASFPVFIPRSKFEAANGISVKASFKMRGASTLMVSRRQKQDTLTFISGLLGAVSGFVGLCVAGMRFFDAGELKARQKVILETKKKNQMNLREANRGKVIVSDMETLDHNLFKLSTESSSTLPLIPGVPAWYYEVEKLMLAGLSFQVAKATMECMMVLNTKAMEGITPRTPVLEPVDSIDDEDASPFGYMYENQNGFMQPITTRAIPSSTTTTTQQKKNLK